MQGGSLEEVFQRTLDLQLKILAVDVEKIAKEHLLVLNHVPASTICALCAKVKEQFSQEPSVLELETPIIAVGDLHGHLLDLYRILQKCGVPGKNPTVKYLFLGDIVDRGEFSLETITLIYLMKALYPKQIYIIRGNHEFEALCEKYGFYHEVTTEYLDDKSVYPAFISSFAHMPIGAVVDEVSVCLHGGIGPLAQSINVINGIRRPVDNFQSPLLASILWSDPCEQITDYKTSSRGTGFFYGTTAINDFLAASRALRLIRGHECVNEGYKTNLDDRVVTIFSASNYCGINDNESAVLFMDPNGDDEVKRFPPLPGYKRSMARFVRNDVDRMQSCAIKETKSAGMSLCTKPTCTQRVFSVTPQPREPIRSAPRDFQNMQSRKSSVPDLWLRLNRLNGRLSASPCIMPRKDPKDFV